MSSTEAQTAPPTEVVYGIAKRMSLDLEKFPLHTHGAILSLMTTMAKHREATMQSEMQQKQVEAQEAAMADARRAHAEQQAREEARLAAQMIKDNATKAPRLSIVLDKDGKQPAQELVATL